MITKLLRMVIVCNELLNQIVAYVPVAFESLNRVSFKLDQNIGNFLVRSLSQTNDQPGTYQMYPRTMNDNKAVANSNSL